MEEMIGKEIAWRGVNTILSGTVECIRELRFRGIEEPTLVFAVKTRNGKYVDVSPTSIIEL